MKRFGLVLALSSPITVKKIKKEQPTATCGRKQAAEADSDAPQPPTYCLRFYRPAEKATCNRTRRRGFVRGVTCRTAGGYRVGVTRREQGRSFRKEEMTGSMGISLPCKGSSWGPPKVFFITKLPVLYWLLFSFPAQWTGSN